MKKRLLFDTGTDSGWIGGIYYVRNIVYQAIQSTEIMERYRIVVITGIDYVSLFDEVRNNIELVIVKKNKWINRVVRFCSIIRAEKIYNYGYQNLPGGIFDSKAVYWIPDFQELFYPEFFPKDVLENRHIQKENIAGSGKTVILSSDTCKKHFIESFEVKNPDKVYVVPFVSAIDGEVGSISDELVSSLKKKYGISDKYVFISNQFWQHKNHKVVFEMIKEAQKKNELSGIQFVFTGLMKDTKNPEYIVEIDEIINSCEDRSQIKILGFISREEQLALMSGAEFIIQPSLFEGWGTVVEDAKVLDKYMLLSDIEVHHEQMNEKCILFNPLDALDLLEKVQNMLEICTKGDITIGIQRMKDTAKEYSNKLWYALK